MVATNTQGVAKILIFLGLITLFTGSILGSSNTSWVGVQNALSEPFPVFSNIASTAYTTHGIGVPDSNWTILATGGGGFAQWSNCEFPDCINKQDNLSIEMIFPPNPGSNAIEAFFNWSHVDWHGLTYGNIRKVDYTINCRQSDGAFAANLSLSWAGHFSPSFDCPKGDDFRQSTVTSNWVGAMSGGSDWVFHADGSVVNYGDVSCDDIDICYDADLVLLTNNKDSSVVVDYISITFTTEDSGTGCVVPTGAWFPFVDEVACAVTGVGEVLWQIFGAVIGIFIFLGQALWWFVNTIANFIYGVIATLAWLLTIPGAPPLAQGLIDIPVIASMGYMILYVIELIRGIGSGA